MRDMLGIRSRGAFTPRSPIRARNARDTAVLETLTSFIALSALVLGVIYGPLLLLIFFVALGVLIAISPALAARDVLKFLPLLALPLLAMLSTIWSDSPERTIRAALQMLLTIAAAIVICRRIPAETLILLLFVAMLAACALAIPSIPRAISAHRPLLGPFASKNAMAYAAVLLVALSLGVLFEKTRSAWWRVFACLAIPPGVVLLVLAESSGAKLSLAIVALSFFAFAIIGRVRGVWRVMIMAATAFAAVIAVVLLPEIESAVADFRQNVLHKDATLTGRTYLWEFAYRLAADRPLLGHGYYAFWRVGNIDAEGLWRRMGIASRSGFNFHNTFIEMRVDLGWVGTIVLCATCAWLLIVGIARQFTQPSTAMAILLALTIGELVRATGETGLFGPFSYYTVLLVATGVYAYEPRAKITGRADVPPRNRIPRSGAL